VSRITVARPSYQFSLDPISDDVESEIAPYVEAEWWFNDGGNIVRDRSGKGHDGVVTGDAIWEGSWLGMSLKTDGSGSYVELGSNPISIADNIPWTVEVLLYTPDLDAQSEFPGVWGNTYTSGQYSRLYWADDIKRWRLSSDANNFTNVGGAGDVINDGEYAHICVVVNRNLSTSNVAMYKNGNISGLGFISMGNTQQTIKRLCCIGSATTLGWYGKTMFIRVYVNTFLTPAQIAHRHRALMRRLDIGRRILPVVVGPVSTPIPVFMRHYRNMRQ
jgi:hypothetical protein